MNMKVAADNVGDMARADVAAVAAERKLPDEILDDIGRPGQGRIMSLQLCRYLKSLRDQVVSANNRVTSSDTLKFGLAPCGIDENDIEWMVKEFLELGADPNFCPEDQPPALHLAITLSTDKAVDVLLKAGARPLLRYAHAEAVLPMHAAANPLIAEPRRSENIIRMLVEAGGDHAVYSRNCRHPLIIAASSWDGSPGRTAIIRALVKQGVTTDDYALTALIKSTGMSGSGGLNRMNRDLIDLLVKSIPKDLSPWHREWALADALCAACSGKQFDTAKYLVEKHRAPVGGVSGADSRPLIEAAGEAAIDIVEWLLALGADPNAYGSKGGVQPLAALAKTSIALSDEGRQRFRECFQVLFRAGADLDCKWSGKPFEMISHERFGESHPIHHDVESMVRAARARLRLSGGGNPLETDQSREVAP